MPGKLFYLLVSATLVPLVSFSQSTLNVTMSNVKNDRGVCRIALYSSAEAFPDGSGRAIKSAIVRARKGIVKVQFDHVPAGVYAIAVIHDENEDGKLNTNLIGIPKEGYGASNNRLPVTSAPRFSESCFTLSPGSKDISIELKYSFF